MILGQIANPQMADIVGALDIRQKRIDADEKRRRDIRARQLIAEALPGLRDDSPLKQLAQEDTEKFVLVSKVLGIPLNSGDKMQQLADDVRALNSLAKADPRQAFYYAMSLQQDRKEQGIESPMIDKFVDQIQTGEDPSQLIRGWDILDRSLNGDSDEKPAGLREFEGMTEGLSPEDKAKAGRIALGLDPRAVGSGAITAATTPGLTTAVAGSEATIKDATKRAEQEAKNATETSKKYFDQLTNINANINNYREGIRLLREEGASTGVVEKRLPSLKAASQKLDNLRNRLGLDVVGGTTFGALSEAELAMALDTAMPSSLQPEELAKWFEERMSAQQKLADILDGAIQFLAVPGNSLADLREEQKKTTQGGSGKGAMTPGITGATSKYKIEVMD